VFGLSVHTTSSSAQDAAPAAVPTSDQGVPLDALPFLSEIKDGDAVLDQGNEVNAFNTFVLDAHRAPAEQLARQAHTDVSFANLVNNGREHYRGWPVRFEGRLLRVRRWEPSRGLIDSGVTDLYECWMLPDFSSNYPVVFLVSELPAGLKPAEEMSRWVRAEGYYFKHYKYPAKDEQNHPVNRFAPYLIGKTVVPLDTAAGSASLFSGAFLAVAGSLAFGLLAVTVGLLWWYRRADRRVIDRLQGRVTANPFEEVAPAYRRPDAPHSLDN
jgi:hypothetical protein